MRTGRLILLTVVALFVGRIATGSPLKVCLVSGSAEYKSDESLAAFQQYLETNYNAICTRAFGKDKGDDLPGIEALDSADVMVLFTRRLLLPADQMAHARKFIDSGKPLVGIRTASHEIGRASCRERV